MGLAAQFGVREVAIKVGPPCLPHAEPSRLVSLAELVPSI